MAEISMRTKDDEWTDVSEDDVHSLGGSMRGTLILPGDEDYDRERTVWNGQIDRRPRMIAKCVGVSDVIDVVNFARERELLVSVRGGGHNVSGSAVADGGLVIDLTGMNSVRVDPRNETVRVEPGVRLGELDRETQRFGYVAPAGLVTDTGVSGLTLSGGVGWLRRKYGLTSDNLLSVDLVTANGNLITASEEENPDLFWAVRGGGGNFGVVTSFEFGLRKLGPKVFFAQVYYPWDIAREAIAFYRDWTSEAPDEVSTMAVMGTVPEEDVFPPEHHGRGFVLFVGMHSGTVDEGKEALRPLSEFGEPIVDLSGPMDFLDVQQFFDADYPRGMQYYWKSLYLASLDDEAIDLLVSRAERMPSPLTTVDIWHMEGVIKRTGPEKGPIGQRDAPYMLGIESNWEDPSESEPNIEWTRESWDSMRRFSRGGVYPNFPGFMTEGDKVAIEAYGEHYPRLQAVKAKYDPGNMFRMNLNIKPSS